MTHEPPRVYHPQYSVPLPPGHRFPMPKFGMLAERLVGEGLARFEGFHQPVVADPALLGKVHEPAYVRAFMGNRLDPDAIRRIGLPWSVQLAQRSALAVGGTCLTASLALEHTLACHVAGGTHHAFPGFGSGFCIFNDLAVAARAMLDEARVRRVLIMDLDVHQGDGTAWIFQDEPRVFTFSMHCQKNFPLHKQRSDLDVPLELETDDETYLALLRGHLPEVLEAFEPDLVLYDAGVDTHANDPLGRLNMTDEGLLRRERYVLETLMAYEIPTACVIGGGYGKDLDELVHRHAIVHRVAGEVFAAL